jgi:hypothetical protein
VAGNFNFTIAAEDKKTGPTDFKLKQTIKGILTRREVIEAIKELEDTKMS